MRALVIVALALLTSACTTSRESSSQPRQYRLDGQILALRGDELLIKHGDIEGFMPGMTMPFKVRDSALLEGKAPGDLVTATLTAQDTDAWIVTLDKTGEAPLTDGPPIPPASFVAPLAPGDTAPDTSLTDQSGSPVSLAAWRGSAVAVTFMYVRCPLPQFCPLLDRRFVEVQRLIEKDPALHGRARLLSVSFDPDADTAARLRAHADKLGADPDIWTFATAPRDVVDRFAATFGVNVIREHDSTITHNMRTTVLGPDGVVVSVIGGSDWTAAQIVDDMKFSLAR